MQNFLYSLAWFYSFLFAIQCKSSVSFVCLDAALSRSAFNSDTGLYLNILGNDAERVFFVTHHLAMGGASLGALAGIFAVLYLYMGPEPFAVALGVTLLAYLMQRALSARNAALRRRVTPLSDSRIQRTTEMVAAIQLVKLYAWEESRAQEIQAVRRKEVKALTSSASMQSASNALVLSAFWLILWGSLTCYIVLGRTVSSAVIFSLLAVISNIRFPLQLVAMSSFYFSDASASFGRLTKLLISAAMPPAPGVPENRAMDALLQVRNGRMHYIVDGKPEENDALANVEIDIHAGELVNHTTLTLLLSLEASRNSCLFFFSLFFSILFFFFSLSL